MRIVYQRNGLTRHLYNYNVINSIFFDILVLVVVIFGAKIRWFSSKEQYLNILKDEIAPFYSNSFNLQRVVKKCR